MVVGGIFDGVPAEGDSLLRAFLQGCRVGGNRRRRQGDGRHVGSQVGGPGYALEGHLAVGDDIDAVFAGEVAQDHGVLLAVGQHRVAVAACKHLEGADAGCAFGLYLYGTVAAGENLDATACGNVSVHHDRRKSNALAHHDLGGSGGRGEDAGISDDGRRRQFFGVIDGLFGEIPGVVLGNDGEFGLADDFRHHGIPPARVAGLCGYDGRAAFAAEVHLACSGIDARVGLEKQAAFFVEGALAFSVDSRDVRGVGGSCIGVGGSAHCIRFPPNGSHVEVDVASAVRSVVLGSVAAGHAYPAALVGFIVAHHVEEHVVLADEGLAVRGGADVEDTGVVARTGRGCHIVQRAVCHRDRLGFRIVGKAEEGAGYGIEGGILHDEGAVVAGADIEEIAAGRAAGIDVVHVASIHEEGLVGGSAGGGSDGDDAFFVVVDFAVDDLQGGEGGRSVGDQRADHRAVNDKVFKVNLRCAGLGLDGEPAQDRLLAVVGRDAVDRQVILDGDELALLVGIGRYDVKRGFAVGNLQDDGAGGHVGGCHHLGCGSHLGSGSVDVGAGEGHHAAAFSGLAEEEGEAVFASCFQVGEGLFAGGEFSVCHFHFYRLFALLREHGHDLDGGKVFAVGGFVPSDCDGGCFPGLDYRV